MESRTSYVFASLTYQTKQRQMMILRLALKSTDSLTSELKIINLLMILVKRRMIWYHSACVKKP